MSDEFSWDTGVPWEQSGDAITGKRAPDSPGRCEVRIAV